MVPTDGFQASLHSAERRSGTGTATAVLLLRARYCAGGEGHHQELDRHSPAHCPSLPELKETGKAVF